MRTIGPGAESRHPSRALNFLCLVLLAFSALALTACDGEDEESSTKSAQESKTKSTQGTRPGTTPKDTPRAAGAAKAELRRCRKPRRSVKRLEKSLRNGATGLSSAWIVRSDHRFTKRKLSRFGKSSYFLSSRLTGKGVSRVAVGTWLLTRGAAQGGKGQIVAISPAAQKFSDVSGDIDPGKEGINGSIDGLETSRTCVTKRRA